MHRNQSKFLLAVALALIAYYVAARSLLPWAPLLIPNAHWARGYVGLQAANTLVLLLLSIPFALVLARAASSRIEAVAAALLVSGLGLVVPVVIDFVRASPQFQLGVMAAIDLVTFFVVLPLLTWLAGARLPSNNWSKPTPLRGAA